MPNESALRLSLFLGIFLLLALAEHIWPRRPLTVPKGRRWLANIVMVAFDTGITRLVVPLMPVAMAVTAHSRGWGLLNQVAIPYWVKLALALLFLDLVIYLQHRAFHRVPLFWRFHRMHHTDLDLDVSSGNRFHPVEILVSTAIKLAAVFVSGAAPEAVVTFEALLNASSLFTHTNLRIPLGIDRLLRLVLVTPDMHRVHHSVIPSETDSNFSFNASWWDRLFGTYRDQPRKGHANMVIGLKEYRSPEKLGFWGLLLVPFRQPYG